MNLLLLLIQTFCFALLLVLTGTGFHMIFRKSVFNKEWSKYTTGEKRVTIGWVLFLSGFVTYLLYEFIGMNFWYNSGSMWPGKGKGQCF